MTDGSTQPRPIIGEEEADQVPEHWRTFGARSSPLTGSPRSAANPANAMLNYLYAILEAEARIALLMVGLDPGLGVLHADLKARDSLALDLMEAVRPRVDTYVLGLLRSHTFAARDFFETRQGVCRVLPPLTHLLAETAPTWAKAVAPHAERIARDLFRPEDRTAKRDRTMPTLLTGANRSAGRGAVRPQSDTGGTAALASLGHACTECGTQLGNPQRSYCDGCLPERIQAVAGAFRDAGPIALASMREAGIDPAHGGNAARKRGETNARHARDAAAWARGHEATQDPEEFVRHILPGLQGVPLGKMAEGTGLSLRWCSLIRRGMRVPHPRHWDTLARLVPQ